MNRMIERLETVNFWLEDINEYLSSLQEELQPGTELYGIISSLFDTIHGAYLSYPSREELEHLYKEEYHGIYTRRTGPDE